MKNQKVSKTQIVATVFFVLFFIFAILYTLFPDMFGETLEGWYKHFK